MCLDMVHMALSHIIHVTKTQRGTLKLKVERKKLAEIQCIAKMRAADIVIRMAERKLVIALSELRRKEYTQHGKVGLIAKLHGKLADSKLIATTCRSRDIHTRPSLSGVVAIPVIIEKAYVGPHQSTSLQHQVR